MQPLLELLADLDPEVRMWTAGSLSNIGKPALPSLIKALDDKNAFVRAGAACAIEFMEITAEEARPAVSALRRLRDDADPAVRDAATAALRQWQK